MLFNDIHHYWANPITRPLVKAVLQMYWNDIEPLITSAGNLRNFILSIRPDLADVLSTKEGIEYLNYVVMTTYPLLYKWAWGDGLA